MLRVKLTPIFFSILLVCLGACSSPLINRTPAEGPTLFEEVFTIKAGENAQEEAVDLKNVVEEKMSWLTVRKNKDQVFELILSKELTPERPYKIVLDINQNTGKYVFKIYHHSSALKDKSATYSMLALAHKVLLNTPAFFELYFNAKAGDPFALANFLSIKDDANQNFSEEAKGLFTTSEFDQRRADNQEIKLRLNSEIKQLKAWQKKENEKRKATLSALDKAQDELQFRTLVAKGDRKGAAKLLQNYLPWEMMAPFERKYWETYLEVVANPVPLEERVLIYRGLDEDFINSGLSHGVALSQKQAILEDNAFVMSSLMVKNQGSWNRRLRSLETMNTKEIGTIKGQEEFAQSTRLTTMFANHSGDPMGSPFISFSPNISIADEFGSKRISAYLIDPRLLRYNYASILKYESEFLVPLTTFPDDLIAIADNELHGLNGIQEEGKKNFLHEKFVKKIDALYGEDRASEVINKIEKNSYAFFHSKFENMLVVEGKDPGPANLKFYKSLGRGAIKADLTPKGELNCKDLIPLFWGGK